MDKNISYTAIIRTLGKAGQKFQTLLDSLCSQSIKPSAILVFLAEGYEIPNETCGKEEYIYVKKGMVAQRALSYEEVKTEWILFLDDDVFLPPLGVEYLFKAINDKKADIVSPDVFDNASRRFSSETLMTLSGRMRARRGDNTFGYKVMNTCGYSYNKNPKPGKAYWSQTNAGSCCLCRKMDFLNIHFEDELWMDKMGYPIGEDQVMYYKMHLMGLKQLTLFGSGIEHLDAGDNLGNKGKELKLIEGDYFFRYVFWHRFIQGPETNFLKRLWNKICIQYFFNFGLIVSFLKGRKDIMAVKKKGIQRGYDFVHSEEFRKLPPIIKKI